MQLRDRPSVDLAWQLRAGGCEDLNGRDEFFTLTSFPSLVPLSASFMTKLIWRAVAELVRDVSRRIVSDGIGNFVSVQNTLGAILQTSSGAFTEGQSIPQ